MIYVGGFSGVAAKFFKVVLSIVASTIGAIMAFVVLMKFAERLDWQNNQYFIAFSKRTMPIYLLHQQLIYVSISIFNGVFNPYMNVAINIAVALFGSYSFIFILYKSRKIRKLMGERG